MANLIYSTAASLDSYIADETGNLDLVGARRGRICVHHRSRAPNQHISLGTQDVRHDGGLGGARGHCWPDAGQAGLRERPTRSFTPNRGRPFLHRRRVWSGNSTRRWFAS